MKIFKLLFFVSFCCSLVGCTSHRVADKQEPALVDYKDSVAAPAISTVEKPTTATASTTTASADTSVTVKVFKSEAPMTGFGYDIYMHGKLYVHQNHIPAIPGQRDFATEKQAQQVGQLMADKISKGVMPPSITVEELRKFGIQ